MRRSTRLATEDPAVARVVELRHFGGLSHEQSAATLGITPSTKPGKSGRMPVPGFAMTTGRVIIFRQLAPVSSH